MPELNRASPKMLNYFSFFLPLNQPGRLFHHLFMFFFHHLFMFKSFLFFFNFCRYLFLYPMISSYIFLFSSSSTIFPSVFFLRSLLFFTQGFFSSQSTQTSFLLLYFFSIFLSLFVFSL